MAVELVDTIDYPFEERFGDGAGGQAQWQALRVRCFDLEVERFLATHPDGTVVALGEGLETQFWRVDNGRVRWLTVDLPETVGLRRRLLPQSSRQRLIARSALDPRWMAEVDASRGVLLTAQGLLMYFEYDEVRRLVAACAEWFPGGALLFDAVPCWLSVRSRSGKLKSPRQLPGTAVALGAQLADGPRSRRRAPHVVELRELRLPRGRGAALGHVVPLMSAAPLRPPPPADLGPARAVRLAGRAAGGVSLAAAGSSAAAARLLGRGGLQSRPLGWRASRPPPASRSQRLPRASRAAARLVGVAVFAGPSIIVMLRPSCWGRCSTTASSPRSSARRLRIISPRSGWAISRPRNMIVTLTLSRPLRKRMTWPFLVS